MDIFPEYFHGLHINWLWKKENTECINKFAEVFCRYSHKNPPEHCVAAGMWVHSIPNYRRVIKEGLNSYVDRINKIVDDDMREGLLHIYEGIKNYIGRIVTYCGNGISADRYEMFLRMMLDDVSKQLPNTKVIIMEPFITHGTSTDRAWECFRSEIDKRIETVRRLAAEYGIGCVHLQEEFERVADIAPAENWTLEGVHPTPAGSTVIKNAWLKLFNNGNF